MSCTLYWRPVIHRRDSSPGGVALRNAIEEEFGLPTTLDLDAVPFLRGLKAAGVDGASELIEAIEKHEQVELYKEC